MLHKTTPAGILVSPTAFKSRSPYKKQQNKNFPQNWSFSQLAINYNVIYHRPGNKKERFVFPFG